jgi:hypothetical protein
LLFCYYHKKGFEMAISFATERQLAFIRNLVSERDVAPVEFAGMTVKDASEKIEALLAMPKKRSTVSFSEMLSDIPKARYALSYQEATPALEETSFDNDYLFLEVREYRGTIYMRQLHGSLGDFTRTRFTPSEVRSLHDIIKREPVRYIQKFGELFTCCGKCGASLTDEASRARLLGPDCARQLGVR